MGRLIKPPLPGYEFNPGFGEMLGAGVAIGGIETSIESSAGPVHVYEFCTLPDVNLDDYKTTRMMPLFCQSRDSVTEPVPPDDASADSGVSDAPPPGIYEWQDYGCLAFVNNYRIVSNRRLNPVYPHRAPEYGIYVELMRQAAPVSTDGRILLNPAFRLYKSGKRATMTVKHTETQRLVHSDRIFEYDSDTKEGRFWCIRSILRDDTDPLGKHKIEMFVPESDADDIDITAHVSSDAFLVESDAETRTDAETAAINARIDDQRLTYMVVMSSEIDEENAVEMMRRLLEGPHPFPAALCGVTCAEKPMYQSRINRSFTVATYLSGRGHLAVQHDFYSFPWSQGDLMYMVIEPAATGLDRLHFSIRYLSMKQIQEETPRLSDETVVGGVAVYIEVGSHPHLITAQVAFFDLPGTRFFQSPERIHRVLHVL